MKRLFVVLLVLSLALLACPGRAEAANPFSTDIEDWNIDTVTRSQGKTSIFIIGKTYEKLDASKIETWTKKGTSWYGMNPARVAYLTNNDSVIVRMTFDDTFFTGNFLIKLKYEGNASPDVNFCYYAASTAVSEICTNPFKQAEEDNSLEELTDGRIRLVNALSRLNINHDEVKLYVKSGAGNPNRMNVNLAFGSNDVSALFDPETSLLNRTYFFEFGDYKSPDFVLQGLALVMISPMEAQVFIGEGTEEAGTIGESGSETTVASDEASDLPEASSRAVGHCSLVTDVTVTGMGILILLLGVMLAPVAAVRIRRTKH